MCLISFWDKQPTTVALCAHLGPRRCAHHESRHIPAAPSTQLVTSKPPLRTHAEMQPDLVRPCRSAWTLLSVLCGFSLSCFRKGYISLQPTSKLSTNSAENSATSGHSRVLFVDLKRSCRLREYVHVYKGQSRGGSKRPEGHPSHCGCLSPSIMVCPPSPSVSSPADRLNGGMDERLVCAAYDHCVCVCVCLCHGHWESVRLPSPSPRCPSPSLLQRTTTPTLVALPGRCDVESWGSVPHFLRDHRLNAIMQVGGPQVLALLRCCLVSLNRRRVGVALRPILCCATVEVHWSSQACDPYPAPCPRLRCHGRASVAFFSSPCADCAPPRRRGC